MLVLDKLVKCITDSNNLQYKLGDHVIVETARGIEYGVVVKENFEINEKNYRLILNQS